MRISDRELFGYFVILIVVLIFISGNITLFTDIDSLLDDGFGIFTLIFCVVGDFGLFGLLIYALTKSEREKTKREEEEKNRKK